MLDVLHSGHASELQAAEICDLLNLTKSLAYSSASHTAAEVTHALLYRLNIIVAHTDSPGASEVPARLSLEVLQHDAAKHHELCVYTVENAVVR